MPNNQPPNTPPPPSPPTPPATISRSVPPRWLAILGSLAPQILQFTPLAPLAIPIANAIDHAEHTGATASDKEQIVLAAVIAAANQYNEDSGSEVINILHLQATLIQLVTGIVGLVNLVHDLEAARQNSAAATH